MQYKFSNSIDIFKLKQKVVANYEHYVLVNQQRYRSLLEYTKPNEVCPVCESLGGKLETIIHGFRYLRCSKCTHVFLRDVLPPEKLAEYYRDDTVEIPYSATYSEDDEAQKVRLEGSTTSKVNFIASFIPEGKRSGLRWLDIACGNGDLLWVAKSAGFEVTGIELAPSLVAVAKSKYGMSVHEGTLPTYHETHRDAKFDVLAFIGILDLLPEPRSYLNVAREILNPGGLLAANVPNYNSLSAAIQKSFPDQTIRLMAPNAFNLFTEQSLKEILRRSGFEPLAIWYFGMDIYELISTMSLESFRFRNSGSKQILIEFVNELQNVLDRNRLSDAMMVAARKL